MHHALPATQVGSGTLYLYMPVARLSKKPISSNPVTNTTQRNVSSTLNIIQVSDADDLSDDRQTALRDTNYPTSAAGRASFRTKAGKRVTPHHWAVYDFSRTIPSGKVTTYKDICLAVGGSPRSVGAALRSNPFAPFVPCHRVIASNLFIGGFVGEWGKNAKTGTQCNRKLDILAQEGVHFSKEGYLINGTEVVWRG